MSNSDLKHRLLNCSWYVALVIACCIATISSADTPKPAINQEQADAILLELKEIRRVLEKIEQKEVAPQAKVARRPSTATVTINKDRPALGSADAPVTVVEFTDYQCPFCKRFTQSTFTYPKRDFIDTGKVRWVVRDMPLNFHTNARKAGQAVHCANEQGKFWEMRDVLFRNSTKLGDADLKNYAQMVGLDVTAFDSCLASDRYLAEIDKDSAEAKRVQITGTPSFVVGKSGGNKLSGKLIIGAQPLNVFAAEIKRLLDEVGNAGKPATVNTEKPAG